VQDGSCRRAGDSRIRNQDQESRVKRKEIKINVCERCGTEVEKRDLEQWYFRITSYADRLLNNIEGLDLDGEGEDCAEELDWEVGGGEDRIFIVQVPFSIEVLRRGGYFVMEPRFWFCH